MTAFRKLGLQTGLNWIFLFEILSTHAKKTYSVKILL